MIVPREGDLVRLYLQLTDSDVLDPETGRVDKNKMGPEKLMQVAKKSFYPYTMKAEETNWWTIYISESVCVRLALIRTDGLTVARCQSASVWRPGSRSTSGSSSRATRATPIRQRPARG